MILKILLPKIYKPSVPDINLDELKNRGIQALIIDLDNTIVLWNDDKLSADILNWLNQAQKKGFKLCIISNTTRKERVEKIAATLGIPIISRALKPTPLGFTRALKLINTHTNHTALIGDQIFTDVFGGNRLGFFTILVNPLTTREFVLTKLFSRNLEKLVLAYFRRHGLLPP